LNLDRLLWKLHLYTGLFLLVGSGSSRFRLILNHLCGYSGYWENREISVEQLRFGALSGRTITAKALELVRVLGRGELEQVRSFPTAIAWLLLWPVRQRFSE